MLSRITNYLSPGVSCKLLDTTLSIEPSESSLIQAIKRPLKIEEKIKATWESVEELSEDLKLVNGQWLHWEIVANMNRDLLRHLDNTIVKQCMIYLKLVKQAGVAPNMHPPVCKDEAYISKNLKIDAEYSETLAAIKKTHKKAVTNFFERSKKLKDDRMVELKLYLKTREKLEEDLRKDVQTLLEKYKAEFGNFYLLVIMENLYKFVL